MAALITLLLSDIVTDLSTIAVKFNTLLFFKHLHILDAKVGKKNTCYLLLEKINDFSLLVD